MNTHTIKVEKELPEEFLSDILITAFDGKYGWSWHWMEPAGEDWLVTSNAEDFLDSHWMSARVKQREGYETGYTVIDKGEGWVVDHAAITRAIQCILDDEYRDIWRPAYDREVTEILKQFGTGTQKGELRHGQKFRGTANGWECETGETARGYREALAKILGQDEPDAGDIDAPFADAIVQVASYGKCIFS